jgi:hypothetical protein
MMDGLHNYLLNDASPLAMAARPHLLKASEAVEIKPEVPKRRFSVADIDSLHPSDTSVLHHPSPKPSFPASCATSNTPSRVSSRAASTHRRSDGSQMSGHMGPSALSLLLLKSLHEHEMDSAPQGSESVNDKVDEDPESTTYGASSIQGGTETSVAQSSATNDDAQSPRRSEDTHDTAHDHYALTIDETLYQRWALPPAWPCEMCEVPCLRYDGICASFVLHPLSRLSMLWDTLLGTFGLWAMVEVPLMLVYEVASPRYQFLRSICFVFACMHIFLETRTLGTAAAARTQQSQP